MIKLLITDIDHTIYSSELGCIPQRNIDAMKELMNRGVTIALATSRIYNGLVSTAQMLGMDKVRSYGVGFNGALVKRYDTRKTLLADPIVDGDVSYLIEAARENNVSIMIYQSDLYLSNRYTNIVDYNFKHVKSDIILTDDFHKYITEPVYQISYSDDDVNMYELSRQLDEKTGHRFNFNCAQPIVIDISPITVSKLAGLNAVIKDMGISLDEVAAMGDGDNDAPMLKAAGLSCCVANGSKLAKESADYVVGACKDAGAADFIYQHVLPNT